MELIVNENSYMTLEEANSIVENSFISSSKEWQFWNNLSDNDKRILIINCTELVDRSCFLYKGIKQSNFQNMQWPRIINNKIVNVPYSLKKGIVLNIINESINNNTQEGELINIGVKSFADGGGARIEFKDNINKFDKNSFGVYKYIWKQYFAEWSMIIGG